MVLSMLKRKIGSGGGTRALLRYVFFEDGDYCIVNACDGRITALKQKLILKMETTAYYHPNLNRPGSASCSFFFDNIAKSLSLDEFAE